jgi:hypothetical protein
MEGESFTYTIYRGPSRAVLTSGRVLIKLLEKRILLTGKKKSRSPLHLPESERDVCTR